ncbi:MAG: hypothetical protein K6B15_08660 [Parasporobacterium sp.]|nr:hypothetical protein [Parasporobacterium sp.]
MSKQVEEKVWEGIGRLDEDDCSAPEEDPTLPVEPTAAADSDASESTTPKTGDGSNQIELSLFYLQKQYKYNDIAYKINLKYCKCN